MVLWTVLIVPIFPLERIINRNFFNTNFIYFFVPLFEYFNQGSVHECNFYLESLYYIIWWIIGWENGAVITSCINNVLFGTIKFSIYLTSY